MNIRSSIEDNTKIKDKFVLNCIILLCKPVLLTNYKEKSRIVYFSSSASCRVLSSKKKFHMLRNKKY